MRRKSSAPLSSCWLPHLLLNPPLHHDCPPPTAAWPQGCRPPSRGRLPAGGEHALTHPHAFLPSSWKRDCAHLLWLRRGLRRGGGLLRLHFGHQREGRQTRGGPRCCRAADAHPPSAHGLGDGALRLGGGGLLVVETLRVAARGRDLRTTSQFQFSDVLLG